MKLITNNYTVLKSLNGGKDVTIKPNVEFEPFEGDFINFSFIRIYEVGTKNLILELNAGQKIKSIGSLIQESQLQKMTIPEIQKVLIKKEISFLKSATKKDLIALLGF